MKSSFAFAAACALLTATPAYAKPATAPPDEIAIRAARSAFNVAIAKGDLAAIGSVLADYAQIMTGAQSLVYSGRDGGLRLWKEDLAAPSRGIYVRTPATIELSPVGPMAFEIGHWKGVDNKLPNAWASGVYSAKWRKTNGKWLIESEIYMTIACAGKYCRNPRQE
jgi:ketosteroid isomerase-like protein